MRRINKNACRRYLFPAEAPAPDHGLFLVKQIKFVVRTSVQIIDHRRILVPYLYSTEKAAHGTLAPVFTMFQANDSFVTYVHGTEVKTRWRTSMLCNLNRQNYCFSSQEFAFYSGTDEERVFAFFKSLKRSTDHETGITAIARFQGNLRYEQRLRRERDRKRAIQARMRNLRPLPRDLKEWLRQEVFPAYFFYDSKKGSKSAEGVCSACGHTVTVERAKYNSTGICPHCGRSFVMKSNKKRGYLWNRTTASVIQKYDENKLIVRIIKGYYDAPKGGVGQVEYYEKTRVIIGMSPNGKPFEEAYYNGYRSLGITTWENGYHPVMYFYQSNFNAETCGFLYCRNLDRELVGTPWQYCQLKSFYEGIQDEMQVAPYLMNYRMIPAIEFFVKLKLYWLVSHLIYRLGYKEASTVINLQGKNLKEVLQIEPSDLSILQRPTTSVGSLFLLRKLREEGHSPDAEFFDWAERHNICNSALMQRALHYTTPHKLMRYLGRQFVTQGATSPRNYGDVAADYRDYLDFCERLHYDLTNEFVLFPRNLKRAHDRARSMIRVNEVKQYDAQIAASEERLKQLYQFSADGFVVMPPHTAEEIVTEGHKLHHCVGSYVETVAKGNSVVLFVRRAKARNTPFYTVELCNGQIVQARGKHNCSPTPKVKRFLDTWEKKVLDRAA